MLDTPATNTPELTVSELAGALKRTVEDRFGLVRLRGEISNYRGPHSSGHAYFCLKDTGARIDAVVWKTAFARLKTKPEEGLEVIATGKITTFPGKSTYQIVVESLEPAGIGALMALFEERRRKLAAEGLFDESRKRPLPFLPTLIGIVTSPTGAVIRDMLHRLADRYPVAVLVWPARMQGDTSAAEVAAGIAGLNALPPIGFLRRPDVIVVARGGGSLEDLWSFNEEIVVRAAAASAVPLVSAVGHETDWTLIDHVADLRAPTPTGAAEKVVPVRADLLTQWREAARRHLACMARGLERRRAEFRGLTRALPGADDLLAMPRQRLDAASARLASALGKGNDAHRMALARLAHRLAQNAPGARLARARQMLDHDAQRMTRALGVGRERRAAHLQQVSRRLLPPSPQISRGRQLLGHHVQRMTRAGEVAAVRRDTQLLQVSHRLAGALAARLRVETADLRVRARSLDELGRRAARALAVGMNTHRQRMEAAAQLLRTLSYHGVLDRGFALVRDADGHPIHSVQAVAAGDRLQIEFADGAIEAADMRIEASGGGTRRRRPMEPNRAGQGRLF